jgi:flagellar assembly protein FliH
MESDHKQNQDSWNMLSPNVIRGPSSDSIRLFSLFDPADDFTLNEFSDHLSHEDAQETNVRHVSATESLSSSEHQAPQEETSPEAVLERALHDAENCLQNARMEAETIKTNAYQEGFQQGICEGREETRQQFHYAMQSFRQVTEEMLALRRTVLNQAENDIVTLACKLAKKIVSHEIQIQPALFTTILHQALDCVSLSDRIVVYVNPNDLLIAQEQQRELMQHIGQARQLTFETDETVERGGCIVRTALGEIDARIDEQLAELERGLRKQIHTSTEENPS